MFGGNTFAPFVSRNSNPQTVFRRDAGDSSQYGTDITYSELTDPRELMITGFEESRHPTDAGDRQSKRLVAYSGPSVDLQVNDRIEHGTDLDGNPDKFEVIAKIGRPHEGDPLVYRYEFENV